MLHLTHRTCFVRQPFPCSFMFDNNCCLCYMHRSKSFAIIIRPYPNLAYHIHGPSKSTLAIWSAKIQSFKFRALEFSGPSNSRSCKFSHPVQENKNPSCCWAGPTVSPISKCLRPTLDREKKRFPTMHAMVTMLY